VNETKVCLLILARITQRYKQKSIHYNAKEKSISV